MMRCLVMAYQITCGMFAIYYSLIQTERYLKNEDTSQISFRTFNNRPNDNYPDVTFCSDDGHLKDAADEMQISKTGFSKILKGESNLEYTAPKTFEKIVTSNSDDYFINLKDILFSYSFKNNLNVSSDSQFQVRRTYCH